MACINLFNPDGAAAFGCVPPPMSPRVSFSSDFAVDPPAPAAQSRAMALHCQADQDPDFEFSVGSRPMIMAADQLFSKGRILPLRESFKPPPPTTTLRDELRASSDDEEAVPSKGPSRWKDLLGLRREHCAGVGAKKADDSAAEVDTLADMPPSTKEL